MDTAIGRQLRHPTWRWITALTVGAVVVGLDLGVHWRYHLAEAAYLERVEACRELLPAFVPSQADSDAVTERYESMLAAADHALYVRLVLAVAAPLVYLALARGDRASVGLLESPRQGWRAWIAISMRAGAVLFVAALGFALVWRSLGWGWESAIAGYSDGQFLFAEGCVRAPVFEEIIYRLALCVPIATRFGSGPAIAASGILFALVHVTYGNLNPASAISGFFFAWVFLKSDSIIPCIALHALGNFLFGLFLWTAGPGPAQLMF
jgi:membrane protease YdiL (CAAX protease family)